MMFFVSPRASANALYLHKTIQVKEHSFFTANYIYGIGTSLAILLVLWICTIFIKGSQKRKKKNIGYMHDDNNLLFKVQELQKELSITKQERDLYKRKFEEAAGELDRINNIEDFTDTKDAISEPTSIISNKTNEAVMYFPSPLPDGSFRKVDARDSFLEGASIYRFRIQSDTEAEFDICEDISSQSMALNNRIDLILSVAEEVEGNALGAKKVVTSKGGSGTVRLEDNKWVVNRKIKVKYI